MTRKKKKEKKSSHFNYHFPLKLSSIHDLRHNFLLIRLDETLASPYHIVKR